MTQNKDKKNLSFRAENLAVPEVIVDEEDKQKLDELEDLLDDELEEIQYETLAIPEFHISKAKAK